MSNIFILADEGVVMEVGNEIPWDPDTACVSICFDSFSFIVLYG